MLAHHTEESEVCWFGVWHGYAQLHGSPAVSRMSATGASDDVYGIAPPDVQTGPRLCVPAREYLLVRGPLSSAPTLSAQFGGQSPNLQWPADRRWCVATEIDLAWTYVGGSAGIIEDLLANQHLGSWPARSIDRFDHESDLHNGG